MQSAISLQVVFELPIVDISTQFLCRKMNEFAQILADRIADAAEPFDAKDDSLLLAHEIMAKVVMHGFIPSDHRVASGDFGADDVASLRDALLGYSRTHSDHPSRGAAYWGLAALHDANDLDLFRDLLQIESSRETVDEQVLWQVMIALDNIGEDIMDAIQTDSVFGAADRLTVSKLYLARHA